MTTASKLSAPQLARWQLELQLLLRRQGWFALSGWLLFSAAAVAWLALPSARQQLAHQQQALRQVMAQAPAVSASQVAPDNDPLSALQAVLDQGRDRDADLRQLFGIAAEEGWDLAQADYRQFPQNKAGVQRLQIQLPLNGNYADIRDLAKALLRGKPNLSLDELSFKRDNTEQASLEATLKLSLWSRAATSAPQAAAGTKP